MVRNRRYTPIQQLQFLRATYKSYRWSIRPSGFTWWFKTSPTAISDDYLLKVVYDQGKQPEVFVVHPKPLKMAKAEDHTSEIQSLIRISYDLFF